MAKEDWLDKVEWARAPALEGAPQEALKSPEAIYRFLRSKNMVEDAGKGAAIKVPEGTELFKIEVKLRGSEKLQTISITPAIFRDAINALEQRPHDPLLRDKRGNDVQSR